MRCNIYIQRSQLHESHPFRQAAGKTLYQMTVKEKSGLIRTQSDPENACHQLTVKYKSGTIRFGIRFRNRFP